MKFLLIILLIIPCYVFGQKEDTTYRVHKDVKATFDTLLGESYKVYFIDSNVIPDKIRALIKKDKYGYDYTNLYGWKAQNTSNKTYYIIIAYWHKWCCGSSYLCFDERYHSIPRYSGTDWCDTCF